MSDRYRIIRSLGGGGMAEVFLASASGAEGFEKPVVIKRLHPHLARQENVARMFLSEARLAMHLSHQNIVQVIDVGRGPEGLYLVMEVVNGWDLSIVLGKGKTGGYFSEPLAAYLASQVASGMSHAFKRMHQGKPILHAHRDISPSNILVTVDGEVKVADFGIARLEEGGGGTEPGSFKGKVPFGAPEVIRGLPASSASDQFSLGIVLYRLLGRGHPYGYTENLVQYAEILSRAGPPQVEFASPPFQKILRRLLALRPEERFASWDELGRELGNYLAQTGTPANASELASYLASLHMPPTPLELMEQAPPPMKQGLSPGLAPPPPPSEFEIENDWQPVATLDSTGRVVRTSEKTAPPPPPARVVREPAVSPALPDYGEVVDAAGVNPGADEPLELAGPTASERVAAQVAAEAAGAPVDTPGYDPLPNRYRDPAPVKKKSILLRVVLGGFVLSIALCAGLVTVGRRFIEGIIPANLLPRSVQLPRGFERELAVLSIDSTPDGATVFIEDVEVGETPLSLENAYGNEATVNVKVTLAGYKPWTGTFVGGTNAHLQATLKRR